MICLSKINAYLALAVLGLILYLPGLFTLPVVDRDEAHFAQASRQMVETGQYFKIRFQEKTRFQKPPGINWLQAFSVKTFGERTLSFIGWYRLPSLLSAILSLWLCFGIFKKRWGQTAAFMAASLLGVSLLLNVEAHLAVIDAALLSAVLMMQGALWSVLQASWEGRRPSYAMVSLFWLAMAYGFLLKGVTPLVGGLSLFALCILDRSIQPLRAVKFFYGLIVMIGLSLVWLLMVNHAEHSNYLMQMFKKDLLPKLAGGHESHGKPPFFHLLILPVTFWPGSLFLWQGFKYAYLNRKEKNIQFLLVWLIPTWIFFELMPTKLPQYVLPTFPVIAMLCILGIRQALPSSRSLKTLQGLWLLLSIILAFLLSALPYALMQSIGWASVGLITLMSLSALCATIFVFKQKYQSAWVSVIMAAVLSYPLFYEEILPSTTPLWLPSYIQSTLQAENITPTTPLVSVGYSEPSLVMLFGTHNVIYVEEHDWHQQLEHYPNGYFLVDEHWIEPKLKNCLQGLQTFRGFNYSKGCWVNLLLFKNIKENQACHL